MRMSALGVITVAGAIAGSVACRATVAEDAPRETLVYSAPIDATTLDPHNAVNRATEQVVLMLYDRLLGFDDQMNLIGGLAEHWEVADDGITWTFRLRDGVRFHDGSPLTAETVKQSFERVLDPARPFKRQPLFAMIEGLEVVAPLVVQLTTIHPFGALEATLAHPAASIVNPAVARRAGSDYGRYPATTSGSGPYRVVEWTRDVELVLERHEGYWGAPPPTRRLVYRPILSTGSRLIALETGDVDVVSGVPAYDVARLEADPAIDVHRRPSISGFGLRFNMRRRPYDDVRVRQAIAYAIDRHAIVDGLLPGVGQAATGPLTPVIRGYEALGTIPHDPARARALLAAAGLPDGFDTRITTHESHPENVDVAQVVAAHLGQVGIDAEVDVMENGLWQSRYRGVPPEENPLEIIYMVNAASTADADGALRSPFLTQPTNEINTGYYSNAEFDRMVLAATREREPERRQALYRRAQEIIYLEDPAGVWLYDKYFVVAARTGVAEPTVSPLGMVTFERAVVDRSVGRDR